MEETKTIKEKTIELIDALKATCQTYGMGNDGNEYKIITQVFLYKFQNENGWVQGSDCIRARKKTPVNMLFLSQYLEGNGVKKQIINAAVGSTMPSLNTDILKDITVLLPNIEEQNRISVALKKIDDKICLNSKINDNLLYQSLMVA